MVHYHRYLNPRAQVQDRNPVFLDPVDQRLSQTFYLLSEHRKANRKQRSFANIDPRAVGKSDRDMQETR